MTQNIKKNADGAYENVFLSVGGRKDRSSRTTVGLGALLDQVTLGYIYMTDGMAAKIVNLPAEEMTRAGYHLEGIDENREVQAELEGLKVEQKLTDALRWSRLFGGALIVMIVDDGGTLDSPLNEDRIRRVDQIRVYDRHDVSRHSYYTDPADTRFGQVELWQVSPVRQGMPYIVHESRCIMIDGEPIPDRHREEQDGWGGSVINRCYQELVRNGMSHVWGNALLERAQQGVLKIPGLSNLLRQPGGEDAVMRRVNLLDMARSTNNMLALDGEEEFTLDSTSFASVADIMDRMGLALSGVSRIPESILHGRQLGGLNSTGASELETWYAFIGQEQRNRLLPAIDRIASLVMKAMGIYTDDYTVEFEPLWVPSAKERAETEKATAETRQTYHDMGALDAQEVRGMLRDEGYPIDDVALEYGEDEETV